MILKSKFILLGGAFVITCLIMIACNTAQQQEAGVRNRPAESENTQLHPAIFSDTTIDTLVYPDASLFSLKLLAVGLFHTDEVWETADKEQWIGLYVKDKNFFLRPAVISLKREFDPIVDQDTTEQTGWLVNVAGNDTPSLLIQQTPLIPLRSGKIVELKKYHINPGDSVQFSLEGRRYMLFATGGMDANATGDDIEPVWNYRLYLRRYSDAGVITQLVVAQPQMHGRMVEVLFVGDIDGDGLVDLIIDSSFHYNIFQPTLYLSKPAEKGQLVLPMGAFKVTGC